MRKTCKNLPILSVVLLAGWPIVATAAGGTGAEANGSHLSALLEKAIFTEDTLGDLDAAIEIYREIASRAEAERSYAARAQYRLGMCYAKKGDKEAAVAALQRVVADFPSDEELVARARNRLVELGVPVPKPAVSTRRVWAGPDANLLGLPSPDGSFLSARVRGELAIYDLETGEVRLLTRRRRGYGARESVVSPDGRQIAYAWWTGEFSELRVIGVDGSGERTLLSGNRRHLQPAAWSSDGDRVLAQWRRHDGAAVIATVAARDGAVDVLVTLDEGVVRGLSLSPDDRYVVHDSVGEAGSSDLFIVDVASKRRAPLVTHAAADYQPLWTPDGRGVLFVSDRGGSPGAWLVGVADGRPIGQPMLLKPDMGSAVPLGFSRSGSLYYGISQPQDDIFTATIDPESRRVTVPPEGLLDRFVGRNNAPAWSPDGERLAYLSHRDGEPGHKSSWALVVRRLETAEEREWPLDLGEVDDAYQPRWSPDGHRLLITGSDHQGRQGFYTLHLGTGGLAPLVQASPEEFLEEAAWSPDGKTLFFSRERGASDEIVAKDLETGGEWVLRRDERSAWGFPFLALSPDGRWLAFISVELHTDRVEVVSTGLYVMPATGGEPRELVRRGAPETLSGSAGLAWTPDGRELFFGTSGGPGEPEERTTLWRVSLDGGDPSPVGVGRERLRNLSLHPDGRQMAFAAGRYQAEVWVIENFLPDRVASR